MSRDFWRQIVTLFSSYKSSIETFRALKSFFLLFIINYTILYITTHKQKLNLLRFEADSLHKTLIQKVKKYLKFLFGWKYVKKVTLKKKIDSSNLFLSLMKRIGDVIIPEFISLVKLLLPDNKTWTISFSLIFRISELIALRSSKRTFRWLEIFWQCIKKW